MTQPASRYALPEYERRFLLDAVPADADQALRITDRFIIDTRLRLRTVTDPATGEVLQHKIGHKVRPDPDDPTAMLHTSLYLDPAEVNVLAMLDAVEVTKTRRRWSHDGHAAAVDTYTGHLAGLVLAELNFADHASLLDYTPSPPLRCEVTNIAELTGPNLASLTPERLAAHLNTLRHRP